MEQANGQGNTDTSNADANVTAGTTAGTQAAGNTETNTDEPGTTTGEGTTTESSNTDGEGTDDQGKTEGDGTGDTEDKGEKKGEGDVKGAPETYEFQAPEGVALDEELLGEFTGIAKELNLSQEDAQRVVDLGPKVMQKFADHQAQVVADAQATWIAEAKADKEIGGDDGEKKLAVSLEALEAFGTPKLKTLLVDSGLGNHPEVIRVFYRIGKAIKNDELVGGRQGGEGPKDLANRLYPNHKS